jgi:hypothetical protein
MYIESVKGSPKGSVSMSVFFSGEILLLCYKEIGKILEFFCFSSANLINFFCFWAKFRQIFYMKKLKKTTFMDIYASMLGSVERSRKIGDGGQSMWLLLKSKKKNRTFNTQIPQAPQQATAVH